MSAASFRRFTQRTVLTCVALIVAACMIVPRDTFAADSGMKTDVDDLSSQISDSQKRVKELDGLIGNYRKQIEMKKGETASLENQLSILDNRIKEKELGVERAKTEIESLNLEIRLVSNEIDAQGSRIETQKGLIADLVRKINREDDVTTFDALLAQPTLSGLFTRLEELKQLQRDLGNMLERVKTVKAALEQKKQERTDKQKSIEEERRRLKAEQSSLEGERNLKTSLVSETKLKETEFERILYELKQQQQSTAEDISALEITLKEKLNSVDQALARGDILINWPVDPANGITAIFHDPTYPFRYLFEHPGTDIRASVGTPVKAAAGGYVAWTKTGRMYGNYMMIVHPGGIATVYAHLSKFIAKPDTYVERQEVIALSGGKPGAPGAGLSTGAHLHFEVRQDGIPVDAENFLPQIPNDYYDYYDEYHQLKLR
jgi:murein DD-endopeptidase MepM/ murein hydrolase activator NlpD